MNRCGVYLITCSANGRVYVGSSLNMKRRWSEHRGALRYGRHHSLLMQRAWNKYGESKFSCKPLLVCSPEDRVSYEQLVMDAFKAANPKFGMNRSDRAVGSPPIASFKGRTHSEETRKLLSARLKGRKTWNKGLRSDRRGVKRDPKVAARVTEARRAVSRIDMATARRIREIHARGGVTQKHVAEILGVPYHIVTKVIRNLSWKEAI